MDWPTRCILRLPWNIASADYFLPQDCPDDPDVAFLLGDRMDREQTKLATDDFFLHGFPGARSYPSQLLQGS